jgi:hypothetical protein
MANPGSFDARQHQPKQLSSITHPIGKFPFQISNTICKPVKDNDKAWFLEVEFTSPVGIAFMRYNLENPSPQAVEIAHGQLSALCYATGVLHLNYQNQGAELKGALGIMEIGWQKGNEPTAEKPEGGYTEVKRVYDKNGNEPGKAPAAAPQTTQGNGAAWGGQPQQQPASPPAQPAWSATQAAPQQQPNQQAPQGWTQGPVQPPANQPPWANK